MRKLISLIFCTTIFFTQFSVAQSEEESIFQSANQAFSDKNYDQAIKLYESILAKNIQSPELYFNLGNCFFQKKVWGETILNYERALLLDPNDPEILQNLALAKLETVDEIAVLPSFFLARWWTQIQELTHSGIWSILGILLLWVGIAGIIIWILGKERRQRKRGFLGGMTILGLSLVVFALAYSSYKVQQKSGSAIIMSKEISLKTLPDEISNEILPLHEGTKVKIIEKVTSWYKVRLDNGEVGWIIQSVLEEI
jgi:tetratricopeptide (TPR) repeat protein